MRKQLRLLRDISNHIGSQPCERGGILLAKAGAPLKQVDFYLPDDRADVSWGTYTPDIEFAQKCLALPGVELRGFVHSHPAGWPEPSQGDEAYVADWFEANPFLRCFHLPIVEAPPWDQRVLQGVNNGELWAFDAVMSRINWFVYDQYMNCGKLYW